MARTGRSRKGIGGPKTPEGRARSLANLLPFQEARQTAEIANGERERHFYGRDRHGAYEITPFEPGTRRLAAQIEAVLQGEVGVIIRPCDRTAVGLLACALRQITRAEEYLDRAGLADGKGRVRPIAEFLLRAIKEARECAEALGLSPRSRMKLGLTLARTTDLAALLAEPVEEEADSEARPESQHVEEVNADGEPASGTSEGMAEGPDPVR